ncbi:MAG: hypothetical protein V1708_02715 [Candidatus Micrarchaeota archaeon]
MKALASVLLCFAVLLSFSAPAFAADFQATVTGFDLLTAGGGEYCNRVNGICYALQEG